MNYLAFFAALLPAGICLVCVDPNGNNVDWFSIYKAPLEHDSQDWKFRDGLAHYYLDVNSQHWTLSSKAMNESDHAVYNTFEEIYKAEEGSILYLMYNDERPDGLLMKRGGHTKGVVAFDNKSGFWMIHSTPKFPPEKSKGYEWPHSAIEFGQTFLCVSFSYEQLEKVGTQLLYNQPHFYDYHIPDDMLKDFPILSDVIKGKQPPGPPWYSVIPVKSLDGQSFTSFAKSNKFGADLYDDLVAPTLKENIMVETWLRHEGTPLDSNCSAKYQVLKIESLTLPGSAEFSETKDHAKWAISASNGFSSLFFDSEFKLRDVFAPSMWTCIGDINRMKSQFKRGGGTMCLQNPDVWRSFKGCVNDYSKCPVQG